MPLTSAQLQTLKTDLAANTNTVLIGGVATAIKDVPHTVAAAYAVSLWYSQLVSPNYFVIRTDAAIEDVHNAINYGKFTPNPAVTSGNAAQASACALYAQTKLMNLDKLIGRPNQSTFDASHNRNVNSLNDAVTNLPTGAAFAATDAGWGNVLPLLSRVALNVEKLFVTAAAATAVPLLYDGSSAQGLAGNPSLMGYEGTIDTTVIQAAWAA